VVWMRGAGRLAVGLGLLLGVGAARLGAQSEPRFEVVSIRAVPPDAPSLLRPMDFSSVLPGGRFIDSRTVLYSLIIFAYDVRDPDKTLEGVPRWAREQPFSVAAQPGEGFPELPPAQNREAVRLMVRAMLAERFQLKIHPETREGRILRLEVEPGGLRLKEVEAPAPPAKPGLVGAAMSDRSGRIVGRKSTMAGLAVALSVFAAHPVQDQTGLRGYYDLDLRWSNPDAEEGAVAQGLGSAGLGLLISNLQSQLGLRLKSARGPIQYWVVDRVERPTEN